MVPKARGEEMNWKKLICDAMPNDRVMEQREPDISPKMGEGREKEKKSVHMFINKTNMEISFLSS